MEIGLLVFDLHVPLWRKEVFKALPIGRIRMMGRDVPLRFSMAEDSLYAALKLVCGVRFRGPYAHKRIRYLS